MGTGISFREISSGVAKGGTQWSLGVQKKNEKRQVPAKRGGGGADTEGRKYFGSW